MILPAHILLTAPQRDWFHWRCTVCQARQEVFAPNGLHLQEALSMGRYWLKAHRHGESE